MWIIFEDVERQLVEEELRLADERIDELRDRGAIWDIEGKFFGLVDKDGRSHFFDGDGNEL